MQPPTPGGPNVQAEWQSFDGVTYDDLSFAEQSTYKDLVRDQGRLSTIDIATVQQSLIHAIERFRSCKDARLYAVTFSILKTL